MSAVGPLVELLRCPRDGGSLVASGDALVCERCGTRYPIRNGTARLVELPDEGERAVKQDTAASFAYEWQRFGGLRDEWRKNFLDYLQPLTPDWLVGKRVLDVGTGSGRHARQAHDLGAEVVAVDLGDSIDVARANLPPDVLTVQADAERLPLAEQSFDLVMSIGVLHHLPDPERALRGLVRFAKPGGRVHVYLYWQPEVAGQRAVLSWVTAARRATVRLPPRVLHALCYPVAAALRVTVVAAHRALRSRPRGRAISDALPLKTYADYPFGVLVNDQFDRFSAPLEQRYTREEVQAMLERAGLSEVKVVPNSGWVGDGVVRS